MGVRITTPCGWPRMVGHRQWLHIILQRSTASNIPVWSRSKHTTRTSWLDLSLTNNMTGPEMAFYFTMRDSNNGGDKEYFGLIGSCHDKTCKIDNSSSTMEQLPDFVM